MTGNPLIDLLISITGIAVMVLVAWLVFPAQKFAITQTKARARIALDEPDFIPLHWLMDSDERSALAEGAGGEFILVERLGLDLVLRRFSVGAAEVSQSAGILTIKLPDMTLPKVKIAASNAEHWMRKLTSSDG